MPSAKNRFQILKPQIHKNKKVLLYARKVHNYHINYKKQRERLTRKTVTLFKFDLKKKNVTRKIKKL